MTPLLEIVVYFTMLTFVTVLLGALLRNREQRFGSVDIFCAAGAGGTRGRFGCRGVTGCANRFLGPSGVCPYLYRWNKGCPQPGVDGWRGRIHPHDD